MRGGHVGKLPSVSCQERLPGHGRSKPTVDVSYGVEALFHPMLDYVFAFLGDSDINILGWQKKFGFCLAGCYGKMRTKCFGQPNTMDRQKCLESSRRTDNQFMLFCSTLILRQKQPCLGREKK